ncbi:uncharacterized protein LOC141601838 [Silene latifolia]|uniref:uncharacterized protein LOC141601838 n=1 Tax=Silene latifolia TaxID=37657 RepID=UPI003D7822F8
MTAGIDANVVTGGLWVGWKKEAKMSLVETCNNFMVFLVEKMNGRLWYLVLFYGASKFELRELVFGTLEAYLHKLNRPFLIVGDFNQVDYKCDKLSACNSHIRGACSFNNWKLRNEFIDIPFKGPRFTWCNNRKGNHIVYDRLDKALRSKEWFTLFPETGIKHHPIQISDHAPIELDLHLTKSAGSKPYKLDAWTLDYPECIQIIKDVWTLPDFGSPTFRVARKLARVRQHVKRWALDKKNDWSDKWDEFDKRLEQGVELATSGGGEEEYELVNMEGRAGRNYILGIKKSDGNWTYDHKEISNCFQDSFIKLYSRPHQDQQVQGITPSSFDQVLRNIHKRVMNDDADLLAKPFTAKEVRQAIFQMGPMKSPGPDGIPAVFYQRC